MSPWLRWIASMVVCGVVPVTLGVLAAPQSARAQAGSETRRYASTTIGASFGDGKTAPAISAALDFRFVHGLGLEFELAYARKLDFTLDLCPSPLTCIRGGRIPVTGRTVVLIPHVTIDLPSAWRGVRPYAVAGVGLAHLRQWYFLDPAVEGVAGNEFKRSKKALALSFGGGVAVQVSHRLTVGADVRSVHLFDDEARPERFIEPAGALRTVRVGSRIGWWF